MSENMLIKCRNCDYQLSYTVGPCMTLRFSALPEKLIRFMVKDQAEADTILRRKVKIYASGMHMLYYCKTCCKIYTNDSGGINPTLKPQFPFEYIDIKFRYNKKSYSTSYFCEECGRKLKMHNGYSVNGMLCPNCKTDSIYIVGKGA